MNEPARIWPLKRLLFHGKEAAFARFHRELIFH